MSRSTILSVKNTSGSALLAGKAVYISGYDKTDALPIISYASCDNTSTMPAVGVIDEDIEGDSSGTIRSAGLIGGFNTENNNYNDDVYVGLDGEIVFTNPIDDSPSYITQQIGVVASVKGGTDGQILLIPSNIINPSHAQLSDVTSDQHHAQLHASSHYTDGDDTLSHQNLASLEVDGHTQYIRVDGDRAFSNYINIAAQPRVSVTVLSASNAAAAINIFDEDYYAAFVEDTNWEHNITAKNITYTPSDGFFTVGVDGTYNIQCQIVCQISAAEDYLIQIYNGVNPIYSATVNLGVADATKDKIYTFSRLVDCVSGDYLQFWIFTSVPKTITIGAGTTINIHMIA